MIVLDLPARMTCVEDGCTKSQPVRIFLNTMGCLQFRPVEEGWQVLSDVKQIGPYVCRCPEHKKQVQTLGAKLQVGPAGPRIRLHGGSH